MSSKFRVSRVRDLALAGNTILADDLIDAIEQDREPISGIERAMLITEVVQGVYASHFIGKRVDLPQRARIHPLEQNA